jgi:ribosomal-protein-alanine N-acetyltransferase
VQKYLGNILIPKDIVDAKRWVNNVNGRCFQNKLVVTWCIELISSREVIGRIDLGGFVRKSMAEMSFYLSPEFWGKSLMTEAAGAVLDYGFNVLNLHRIQATVLPENHRSVGLIEKLRFKREGLLRKYNFGNEFHDVFMFALLKEDFEITL